jgi:hypothetical protein
MPVLVGCIGLIVLTILGIMARAFALAKLWAWFIVPIFSLPSLTMAQAYGVALVVNLFTEHHSDAKEEDDEAKKWTNAIVKMFVGPLIALIFGWLVKTFWL